MPPLPPIWDPAKSVDRLPQPFRMIDKVLAEIVEAALDICLAKEKQKRVVQATHIDTVFAPHAVVVADGQASCFTTLGVGGMAIVGTLRGELMSHTARDPSLVVRQPVHPSAVTALDIGHIAATGTKVVASVSRERLVVHEVVIRNGELKHLAQVDLPEETGDAGQGSSPAQPALLAPASVTFSPNAGHVAVCWPGGPVAVYEVELPAPLYDSSLVDRPPEAPPLDLSGGLLSLALHFPQRIIKALLVGNTVLGVCNVVWQQQQRPDKTGRSDRAHRPAKGVYMWWQGCNKLALSYLAAPQPKGKPELKLPPIAGTPPPAPSPTPPMTPPGGKQGAKGGKGAAPAPIATGPESAQLPGQSGAGAGSREVVAVPSKGWLLPMGISHSCYSENGKMLAFGMCDGSTLVWDDHFGGHTRILPRMPAPVTALAFVNGAPNLLFVTSADGSVYLADLNKPEDSHMSRTKLPHAAHQVYFLPSDPFVVCTCFGDGEQQPRLVWFNMQDEKLAAELSGKDATRDVLGFGRAGLCVPPRVLLPAGGAVVADAAGQRVTTPTPRPVSTTPGQKPPAKALAGGKDAAPAAQPPPSIEAVAEAEAEAAAAAEAAMMARPYPAVSFRDSYLVTGGPIVQSASYRPPEDGPPPDPSTIPKDAHLYLYKIDAIARMLLPEEIAGTASKSLLNRMLADLNPPKIRRSRVKMGVPDPTEPKPPPSAMRKTITDVAPDESMGGRRHIKFNESDLEGLLNEETKGKTFKKETIKGGYSDGRSKQITDTTGAGTGTFALPALDMSTINTAQPGVPAYMQERPQSPPWHHTNPLARIHPDWEEAQVLTRIMEKLGSKGGGRRRRERRMGTVAREMQGKMAKESGPRAALLHSNQ